MGAALDLTQGDLLTHRGIVGGLLAGTFIGAALLTSETPKLVALAAKNGTEIAIAAAILGIAATHIVYEVYAPLIHPLLRPLAGFVFTREIKHCLGLAARPRVRYDLVRTFREWYLIAHSADQYSERLRKSEQLRRTSMYLTAASSAGAVAAYVLVIVAQASMLPLWAALSFAAVGLTAQFARSYWYGKQMAYAYIVARSESAVPVTDLKRVAEPAFVDIATTAPAQT